MNAKHKKTKHEIPPSQHPLRQWVGFFLKLLITSCALFLVFRNIDAEQLTLHLKSAYKPLLVVALLVLNLGQLVSAMRLRFYYAANDLMLGRAFAVGLYYMGMLFNLVLPGGIGGDGYQAYFMQRTRKFSWKHSVRIVLSARANGLLCLIVYAVLLSFFSARVLAQPFAIPALMLVLVLVFPCYSVVVSRLLKEKLMTQLTATRYSLVVQGMGIVCCYFLLMAFGHGTDNVEYILLFLISSIVSILPVSVGGVGLRELTFFYGTQFFGLDTELGIALSVTFFVLNSASALLGIVAFHKLK